MKAIERNEQLILKRISEGFVTEEKLNSMTKQNKNVGIRIPDALLQRLESACGLLNESKSTVIRKALICYLDYFNQEYAVQLQERKQTERWNL